MPARVALLARRGDHALLDVVVDHRPRDEGLARDLHELELLRDEREQLVEVELDARHLADARDVHGAHPLRERLEVVLACRRGAELTVLLAHGTPLFFS